MGFRVLFDSSPGSKSTRWWVSETHTHTYARTHARTRAPPSSLSGGVDDNDDEDGTNGKTGQLKIDEQTWSPRWEERKRGWRRKRRKWRPMEPRLSRIIYLAFQWKTTQDDVAVEESKGSTFLTTNLPNNQRSKERDGSTETNQSTREIFRIVGGQSIVDNIFRANAVNPESRLPIVSFVAPLRKSVLRIVCPQRLVFLYLSCRLARPLLTMEHNTCLVKRSEG